LNLISFTLKMEVKSEVSNIKKTNLQVIIVEDDPIIAQLTETYIKEAGHIVVGIAHDSETALDMIHNRNADFLILDINIEGERDGIEVGMIVKEKYQIPFIYITAYSDLQTLERAKKSQPCAYIVKPYQATDLFTAMTIGLYNYQGRKHKLTINRDKINQVTFEQLTHKEFDILVDICDGLTNAQIAAKQFLSLSTIKWHNQNIYSKLGTKNRAATVKFTMNSVR